MFDLQKNYRWILIDPLTLSFIIKIKIGKK